MRHDKRPSESASYAILREWLEARPIAPEEIDRDRNPSDPPDFCFKCGGKAIAVEHTRVFGAKVAHLNPLHNVRIERRICGHVEAWIRRELNRNSSVDVSVRFLSCKDVKRADEERVAHGLCDLIQRRLAEAPSLPLELHLADLRGVSSCFGDALVTASVGPSTVSRHAFGRVDEWGLEAIQAAAERKQRKLLEYHGEFDQRWLLLEVGGPHQSQWIEPSESARSQGIVTSFDRVFVVDPGSRRVAEIGIKGLA